MPAFDLAVLVHYERPWPYEAHLAEQDVEELRELIQRRSAEELSDLGDPGIGGALEQPGGPGQAKTADAKHRQSSELVELDGRTDELERTREDAHAQAEVLGSADE